MLLGSFVIIAASSSSTLLMLDQFDSNSPVQNQPLVHPRSHDNTGLSLSNTPARRAFLEAGNTKWVLIGFGLPFAVIGAIPILGA